MLNIVHAELGHSELDGKIHVCIDTTGIHLGFQLNTVSRKELPLTMLFSLRFSTVSHEISGNVTTENTACCIRMAKVEIL